MGTGLWVLRLATDGVQGSRGCVLTIELLPCFYSQYRAERLISKAMGFVVQVWSVAAWSRAFLLHGAGGGTMA
jgi:hypothetical protein